MVSAPRDFAITLFLAVFMAKIVFVLFLLVEDIYRFIGILSKDCRDTHRRR
jgi:hypothetical protein